MSRPVQRRLPLQPLLDACGERFTHIERANGDPFTRRVVIPAGMEVYAEHLSVSVNTLANWKKGGVPIEGADNACVRAGFHPIEVWGDDWLVEEGVSS